jgi:hypothetical protein
LMKYMFKLMMKITFILEDKQQDNFNIFNVSPESFERTK